MPLTIRYRVDYYFSLNQNRRYNKLKKRSKALETRVIGRERVLLKLSELERTTRPCSREKSTQLEGLCVFFLSFKILHERNNKEKV